MKPNENISKYQMIYITANFTIGSSLIAVTGLKYAKKDNFICDILGLCLGLLVALMTTYITDKFPNMEYTQILDKLFNRIGGRIIALIYLIFSIFLISLVENDISGLISTMVMNKTPTWILSLSITLIISYIFSKGIENFSLNVELLFPLSFVLIIFIYIILLIKFGDLNNLFPIFVENPKNIIRGTLDIFSFPYLDNCILVFIYSLSKNKVKKHKVIIKAYLIISPLFVVRSLAIISVLGIDESLRYTYPLFEAVRLIQIGNYIERLELLLLISWVINVYVKLGVCYYVILKCLQYIFNLDDYKKLSMALLIFVIPLSLNTISNIQDIYIDNIIPIPTIFVVTILVFIQTLIVSRKNSALE